MIIFFIKETKPTIVLSKNKGVHASQPKDIKEIPGCRTNPERNTDTITKYDLLFDRFYCWKTDAGSDLMWWYLITCIIKLHLVCIAPRESKETRPIVTRTRI